MNTSFSKIISVLILIVSLNILNGYDEGIVLKQNEQRITKSYSEELLPAEAYYEAALKGELQNAETKRDPLLLSSMKLVGKKTDGLTEGGVYQTPNGDIWIVKKGQNPVNEYLGSKVMDLLIGPWSPEVVPLIDAPGYTASKLLPSFLTKNEVLSDWNHKPIVGEIELEIAMDLIGLTDRHTKNLGYIEVNDKLVAARVDFDNSFDWAWAPLDIEQNLDLEKLKPALKVLDEMPDAMILYVLGDAYNNLWEAGIPVDYAQYKDLGSKLIERKRLLNSQRLLFFVHVQLGDLDAVQKILEEGADINAKTSGVNGGLTALHYAILNGNTNMVRLLLDNGADINAKDSYGTTPFNLAVEQNERDIINLLKTDSHLKLTTGDRLRETILDILYLNALRGK